MALSLDKQKPLPPRILIYGVPKFGKSTFASMAPDPIFIQTEEGLDFIDCPRFPLAKSFQDVLNYLKELAEEDHDYKTVVVDSLDWLEPLIWEAVCKEAGVKNIEDVDKGFGKGYNKAIDLWVQFIDCLDYLRENKKMMVINIAHSEVKRFDDPIAEPYDRYVVKLHKAAAAKITEYHDIILFGGFSFYTKKKDVGFNKEVTRAVSDGSRVLYTEQRPSFVAGNKVGLPPEIPFDRDGAYWATIASKIPFFNKGEEE